MDDPELNGPECETRPRLNTWPLKRFLTEDHPHQQQPPEPFQIQYEDSNHSTHSFNPATSPIVNFELPAFPSFECYTSDASQQSSVLAYPASQSTYPYGPSTSANNFASLLPTNDMCLKEEGEDDEQHWCRQNQDTSLGQRKMNPWGEASYSDLISRALETAPNSRLKLNEIYQWFIDNVPYFNERSSPELASGWKVSKLTL